jgi:hypothetical protein
MVNFYWHFPHTLTHPVLPHSLYSAMAFFAAEEGTSPTLEETISTLAEKPFSRAAVTCELSCGLVQLGLNVITTERTGRPALVVQSLYVPEGCRNMGVCRAALLEELPKLALKYGFCKIMIQCINNAPLRQVLLKWGREHYVECDFGFFVKHLADTTDMKSSHVSAMPPLVLGDPPRLR